jgi:hypothetical protein
MKRTTLNCKIAEGPSNWLKNKNLPMMRNENATTHMTYMTCILINDERAVKLTFLISCFFTATNHLVSPYPLSAVRCWRPPYRVASPPTMSSLPPFLLLCSLPIFSHEVMRTWDQTQLGPGWNTRTFSYSGYAHLMISPATNLLILFSDQDYNMIIL